MAAMSTDDNFSERKKTPILKNKLIGQRKDSDDEAEFDDKTRDGTKYVDGSNVKQQGVRPVGKIAKLPAVRPVQTTVPPPTQLPLNSSAWSLNDHCRAVVTTDDPKLKLSSLKFLLKRFETGESL